MASIREKFTKDGKLFYEIRVRRGRDRSEVTTRWYPPEGKAASTIKRLLENAARDFEREVSDGKALSAHEQKEAERVRIAAEAAEKAKIKTVRQFSEVVMEKIAVEKSENTRTNYQCLLDRHILPVIGDMPVQDVTSAEIDSLLTKMLVDKYKLSTRQRTWTVLNLLFKAAKRQRLIRYSPMDDLDGERPAATKAEKADAERKKDAFLDADAVKRLLNAVDGEPLKWRCFIWLLALTGIRRGEACGLEWKDIDFEKQEITISKSLNYTAEKGVYLSDTKSGKTRIISLNSEDPGTRVVYASFFGLLKDLRVEQKQNDKVIKLSDTKKNWVFRQEGSREVMHPDSPTKFFKVLGNRIGIPNLHPHALRHSFCSIAIAEGQDVVAVSRTAGHADARVTLAVYAHANTESVRKVTGAVGKALSGLKAEKTVAGGE